MIFVWGNGKHFRLVPAVPTMPEVVLNLRIPGFDDV